MIVSSTLEFARNGHDVTVVAEDTDVLIMLLYHWAHGMADIFIRKEGRQKRTAEMFSTKEANTSTVFQKDINFIHSWSGCDTPR